MEYYPGWYSYLYPDYGWEENTDPSYFMNKAAFIDYYIEEGSNFVFWPPVRWFITDDDSNVAPIEAILDYFINMFEVEVEISGFAKQFAPLRLHTKWKAIITENRTIAEMISAASAIAGFVNAVDDIKRQMVHLETYREMNEELTDYVDIQGDKQLFQGIRGKTDEELYDYLNDCNPQVYDNYNWFDEETRVKKIAEAFLQYENEDASIDDIEKAKEILSGVMIFKDEE